MQKSIYDDKEVNIETTPDDPHVLHNNASDSILRLQDLGLIQRVEGNVIYLTLIILVANVILILLGLDILNLLPK